MFYDSIKRYTSLFFIVLAFMLLTGMDARADIRPIFECNDISIAQDISLRKQTKNLINNALYCSEIDARFSFFLAYIILNEEKDILHRYNYDEESLMYILNGINYEFLKKYYAPGSIMYEIGKRIIKENSIIVSNILKKNKMKYYIEICENFLDNDKCYMTVREKLNLPHSGRLKQTVKFHLIKILAGE